MYVVRNSKTNSKQKHFFWKNNINTKWNRTTHFTFTLKVMSWFLTNIQKFNKHFIIWPNPLLNKLVSHVFNCIQSNTTTV